MADSGTQTRVPRKRSLFERVAEPLVASRPGAWWYVNVAPVIDRPLLRVSGGRFSSAGFGRVGLLRVRGAKSGQLRETPLVYARDGERILLVASRGGDVKHPAWFRNLMANPDVTFEAGGEERSYRARRLEGEEREEAWWIACERYSGYRVYQRRAGNREIPVVALEPADPTR